MSYLAEGVCKNCTKGKSCLSSSIGLACNYYESAKAEQERFRKAEQERILKFLKKGV